MSHLSLLWYSWLRWMSNSKHKAASFVLCSVALYDNSNVRERALLLSYIRIMNKSCQQMKKKTFNDVNFAVYQVNKNIVLSKPFHFWMLKTLPRPNYEYLWSHTFDLFLLIHLSFVSSHRRQSLENLLKMQIKWQTTLCMPNIMPRRTKQWWPF